MNRLDEKIPMPQIGEAPLPPTFGGYLKGLRRSRGVTQRGLAAQIGRNFTYISKIENDRLSPPSEETCKRIALVFGVDPWEITTKAGKLPSELVAWLLELPVRDLHELAGQAEEAAAWEGMR